MPINFLRRLSTLAILLSCAAAIHAQLPKDNDVWKMRCNLLASYDQAIQTGTISPVLVAATRGVPGSKFTTFAFDRSGEGEHNVACVLFYMAAIADRAGNGGKQDASAAHDAAVLASIDVKQAHGADISFTERLKRTAGKAGQITEPSLTSSELMAILNAATTMPLSTNPPPATPAPKAYASNRH